jgi:hypothetical protein
VDKAPLCSAQFGPRDVEWPKRLAEELSCLIKFISACKASGFDWIRIHPDDGSNGVSWSGQVRSHSLALFSPFLIFSP